MKIYSVQSFNALRSLTKTSEVISSMMSLVFSFISLKAATVFATTIGFGSLSKACKCVTKPLLEWNNYFCQVSNSGKKKYLSMTKVGFISNSFATQIAAVLRT